MATLPPITGLVRLTCAADGAVQGRVTLSTSFGERHQRAVSQTYDLDPADIPETVTTQLQELIAQMIERRTMDLYRQTFEAMSVAQRMGEEL